MGDTLPKPGEFVLVRVSEGLMELPGLTLEDVVRVRGKEKLQEVDKVALDTLEEVTLTEEDWVKVRYEVGECVGVPELL